MQDARCRIQEAGHRRLKGCLVLVTLLLLALVVPVLAQVSSNYDLWWHAIAGGGGRMESAGGHTVLGTTGQALIGTMKAGSGHTLCSSFWCGTMEQYRVYLPLVVCNFHPSSGLILSENFDDGALTGWTPNNGTWTNPGAQLQGEYATGNAWNIHSSTGSDIVYTGTVNLLSGNAVGLVFRSSADGTSSYDALLDAVDNVFKISKRQPYQVLASYSMTVQRNHPYTIKVVASGSRIDAYLDGVKRLTVTDSSYASGYLGVMLFCATATYDDLEARGVP
jgi:hypothetical protein